MTEEDILNKQAQGWAALAAAIAVNEKQGRDKGRRSKKPARHLQQALTGEGMANDMEALGDRVGGPGGKSIEFMGKMGSPIDATKWAAKKGWKPWEWF